MPLSTLQRALTVLAASALVTTGTRAADGPSLAVVPGYPLRASPPICAVRTGRSRASSRPLPTWLPIDTWMPVGPRLAGITLLASRSRRPRRALDSLT